MLDEEGVLIEVQIYADALNWVIPPPTHRLC